jgi:hypothetical protein
MEPVRPIFKTTREVFTLDDASVLDPQYQYCVGPSGLAVATTHDSSTKAAKRSEGELVCRIFVRRNVSRIHLLAG